MNHRALPAGYRQIDRIDLVKNRRQMLIVNIGALAISAVLVLAGLALRPFAPFWEFMRGSWWVTPALALAYIAYITLHELTHGIVMRLKSGVKPKYGFNGLYAYAGGKAYFDRPSYILVALAPVIVWGAVFALLGVLLPEKWFWFFHILQIGNVSGAAGDIYCTCFVLKKTSDILILDSGTDMQIFAPLPQEETT